METRLIDFANVSTDTSSYKGVDEGCLLGLDNLTTILSRLLIT